MNIPWLCVFLHNRSHSLYQLACGDWLLVYQEILLRQLSCSSDQHPVKRGHSLQTVYITINNRFSIYGYTVPLRRAYFKRVSFLEQISHRFEINTAFRFIPVVRTHSAVHHANVFGYRLNFVHALFIIQYGLLFLLSCKHNSVWCCK